MDHTVRRLYDMALCKAIDSALPGPNITNSGMDDVTHTYEGYLHWIYLSDTAKKTILDMDLDAYRKKITSGVHICT